MGEPEVAAITAFTHYKVNKVEIIMMTILDAFQCLQSRLEI